MYMHAQFPCQLICINMGAVGHQKFFVNKTIVSPVAPKRNTSQSCKCLHYIFTYIYFTHVYVFCRDSKLLVMEKNEATIFALGPYGRFTIRLLLRSAATDKHSYFTP